jgi:uridine phosphorylase
VAETFPILEFDPAREALIDPPRHDLSEPVPQRAVVCFFREVIDEVCGDGQALRIDEFNWEHGSHDLYRLTVEQGELAVFHPGVGAPLAAGILEEAIAVGCRTLVVCGGAGAIVPGLALGHVVVPTAAVRDEGTSYHYCAPAREIEADARAVRVASELLEERGVPHLLGKTWTTDAPFRETPAAIRRRRDEGCVTVEMEASAFMAVAQFRGVDLVQYLYAGDDVSGETWDHRRWTTSSARRDLFWLAVETAFRL